MAGDKPQGVVSEQQTGGVGIVHVMPPGYQGGKMPEAMSLPQVSLSSKPKTRPPESSKEVKAPSLPVKPAPLSTPVEPTRRSLRKTMMIVVSVVAFVAVSALAVVWFLAPEPTPVVVTPTPNPFPTPVPIPQPTPEPPREPVPEPTPLPVEILPGRDTDSDGLTDVEEPLYGSNVRLPDSDEDGFLDGNEVYHGYAPALPAPATLLDKNLTVLVQDPSVPGVVAPSPLSWGVSSDTVNALFALVAPSGEQIVFRTYPKEVTTPTLEAWILTHAEIADDGPYLFISAPSKLRVKTSQNKRHAFVELKEQILEVSYDLGDRQTIEYLQTFQYIVGHVHSGSSL